MVYKGTADFPMAYEVSLNESPEVIEKKSANEPQRLLVAVDADPSSMHLVRKAALMAQSGHSTWFAVNVDNARIRSKAAQNQLTKTLSLAQQLGAEIVLTADLDIARGILRVARQKEIGQVILGKSTPAFLPWRFSAIHRILAKSTDFDVVLLRTGRRQLESFADFFWRNFLRRSDLVSCFYAAIAVGCLTVFNFFLRPQIGAPAVLLVYFLAVLVLSLRLTRNAVFVSAGLAALAWNYFFITPLYTLHIERLDDTILFFLFFAVAFVAAKLRTQRETGMIREEKLSVLYNVASRMNRAYGLAEIVRMVTEDLKVLLDVESTVCIINEERQLESIPKTGTLSLNKTEAKAAKLAFRLQKPVGRDSGLYSGLERLFIPLRAKDKAVGVIALKLPTSSPLATDQVTLLYALLNQLAVVIHREMLLDKAQKIATSEQIDNLYRTLLNLITHEIRTPIAIIKGSLTALANPSLTGNAEQREDFFNEVVNASDRLNRLIGNLLDMSRIESGQLKLNLDWCDLAETVHAAARDISAEFPESRIDISNDSAYLLRSDFNLLEKVFYLLMRNAIVHNIQNEKTRIKVNLRSSETKLLIAVEDNGTGLPQKTENNLFAKFSRGNDGVDGLGLGLSVVKGILDAHGAEIRYHKDGGARFLIQFKITRENSRPFRLTV